MSPLKKSRTALSDIDVAVRTLASASKQVHAETLARQQSEADERRWATALGDEIDRLQALGASPKAQRSEPALASLHPDDAAKVIRKAMQANALTALNVETLSAYRQGKDFRALLQAQKALTSVLTGSGDGYKVLQRTRKVDGKTNNATTEDGRARLLALLALVETNIGKTKALYTAAELELRQRRAKISSVMSTLRNGSRPNPTFQSLLAYWQTFYQPREENGDDVVELFLDPYKEKP
jgi:hypothetical protein